MYTSICAQNDALFSIGNCYLYVQHCSGELAYDFTLYDRRMCPLDGGVTDFDGDLEESSEPFRLAAKKIAEYFDLHGKIEEIRLSGDTVDRLFRNRFCFA